jgi:peptidoglycan/LPS O-acetylase OafA/YrhL
MTDRLEDLRPARPAEPPHAPSQGSHPTLGYRPALDGIRAVAVGAVIAYHLGWIRGGFLGVDVFFVLSGYLITTLLLQEVRRSGAVDLPGFWARRARRLLPAVVLLVLVLLVELDSIQSESAALSERRDDIVATLLYFANWHFIASDQSYFASFVGVSPLRHTWSLAIEEQFYLLFPLLLLLVARFAKSVSALLSLIVVGILGSTALMALTYDAANPSRAYFGTDARIHVLLVGAALAVFLHQRPQLVASARAQRLARVMLPATAAVILATFLLLRDQEAAFYHGGALAFACVVALSLWSLEAVPDSVGARGISVGPVRWMGKISYSLYLWHWPVIIWVTSFVLVGSAQQSLLAIVATFAMATFSFYVVERPIRQGHVPWLGASRRRLAVAVPVSLALVVGLTIHVTSDRSANRSETPCPPGSPTVAGLRWCVQSDPVRAGAPVVATAGDSTSRSLSPGLISVAERRGWRYVQAGQNGCSILPLEFTAGDEGCANGVPRVLAAVKAQLAPDVWLVSDVFAMSALREPDGSVIETGDPRRTATVLAALRRTVLTLTSGGGEVVLIEIPPEGAPEQCGARTEGRLCGAASYSVRDGKHRAFATLLRRLAAAMPERATYVPVADVLCGRHGQCPYLVDGVPARYDGVHYTAEFSRKIARIIIARAERAGVRMGRS